MPTRNLVRIESNEVGPVPLVSSHPYARSVCFRFCDPLFLLPDSGGLAIGDPRSSPPDQRAAEIAAWACSPEGSRPVVLDVAYAPWVGWRSVLAIVKPETVVAWHRKGFRLYWTWKSRHGQPGRPALAKKTRELIRKMSLANPLWGAPRIHGELLKLGIALSQATVAEYIVHTRRPPSQSWRAFLNNHVDQLVSRDFFVVPTATFRLLFVFVVLAHPLCANYANVGRRLLPRSGLLEQPFAQPNRGLRLGNELPGRNPAGPKRWQAVGHWTGRQLSQAESLLTAEPPDRQ